MTSVSPKTCGACGKAIKGRADKKFCDDYCRNAFNNQLNSDTTNYVRNVNNILRRNRRLLEENIPAGEETFRISKNKLIEKGFVFKHFTHTYTNKKGTTYFFCYEYGYMPVDNDWFLLVKQKQELT